jgi:hypothetical protein
VGIKAGTQPKQEDRLFISSGDALELVQLITGKMSDRQSVYAELQVKKIPVGHWVLQVREFCQTYFFLEIF